MKIKKRLVLIDVYVNKKIKTFIFDTGANHTFLNSKYFKSEKIDNTMTISGISNSYETIYYDFVDLEFQNIKKVNYRILIKNLEHVEKALKREIHGIFGRDLYDKKNLFLSYKNKKIKFLSNSELFKLTKRKKIISQIKFIQNKKIFITEVDIENRNLNIILDTGASVNLFDENIKFSSKLININQKMVGISDSKNEYKISVIKKIIFNKKIILKDSISAISSIDSFKKIFETNISGIIGYDFFKKYKLLFDNKNNYIYIMR